MFLYNEIAKWIVVVFRAETLGDPSHTVLGGVPSPATAISPDYFGLRMLFLVIWFHFCASCLMTVEVIATAYSIWNALSSQ